MPIRRNKNQSNESLIEFYKRDEWTDIFEVSAQKMLLVVDWLNTTFKRTELVGTTSHQRLVIHASSDDESAWSIIISNSGLEEYQIEYKVPEDQSPWKNAWIYGAAQDFEELTKYLLIAMDESANWINNDELINMLKA